MQYKPCGKQVLERFGKGYRHYADARDPAVAQTIANALNGPSEPPEIEDIPTPGRHHVRQEGDEYVCRCGRRWDMREGSDHP